MDAQRIAKTLAAIRFIEENLTQKLDLARVAAAVHYSKYHLHRVFTDTVGLTIHHYIQRRQLTEAAAQLVFSKRPILQIAIAAGYESQQAFTNTFTALYKQPPHQYRANKEFYPLQLRFRFEGACPLLFRKKISSWRITPATEEDTPCWMELVPLVVDGFPHWQEAAYRAELQQYIRRRQALLVKDGPLAVGALLFSRQSGTIDFMGIHPLYRKMGIAEALLEQALGQQQRETEISITTYRAGDRADTGHRRAIEALGFAAADLLTEFGYPTQRFILPRRAERYE